MAAADGDMDSDEEFRKNVRHYISLINHFS